MSAVLLDPVTRMEGHLRIDTRVEQGQVVEAWSRGGMFRGFESILVGRDPLDAPVITQRICGVCPVSHAVAACRAVEAATGVPIPSNGRLLRNLVLGAEFLQSHILHFNQLSASVGRRAAGSQKVTCHRGRDAICYRHVLGRGDR